jgi:predicted phosphoribosyltransferase
MKRFRDRREAGELLALELAHLAGRAGQTDCVILALPRGGVPVAYKLSCILRAPLDILVVRKLGVPGHEELAMGAIATGGVRFLNENVVSALGIDRAAIAEVEKRELEELLRREKTYRGDRMPLEITGKTVILVDDGIATGATVLAAIEAVRRRGAARIVVASPVSPASVVGMLRRHAEEVHCVLTPEDFGGVGQWYDDFSQTEDGEVRRLLDASRPTGKMIGIGDPEPLFLRPVTRIAPFTRHES